MMNGMNDNIEIEHNNDRINTMSDVNEMPPEYITEQIKASEFEDCLKIFGETTFEQIKTFNHCDEIVRHAMLLKTVQTLNDRVSFQTAWFEWRRDNNDLLVIAHTEYCDEIICHCGEILHAFNMPLKIHGIQIPPMTLKYKDSWLYNLLTAYENYGSIPEC